MAVNVPFIFGGFVTSSGNTYDYYGLQVYTGSEANPVFAPGVYDYFYLGTTGTLTVTAVSVVPETSTWAMMLAGFAGLGFLGYRRNKATTLAA